MSFCMCIYVLFKTIPTLDSACISLLIDYHMCCITISLSNTLCRSCGQSLNHHIDFHQLFGPPVSGTVLRCCYFYVEIDGLSSYTSFYLFCYSNLSIWPHTDLVLVTEYGIDYVCVCFLLFPFYSLLCSPSLQFHSYVPRLAWIVKNLAWCFAVH